MYPHLINIINTRHHMSVVSNSNECWLDFGVSISRPNHNIKTHPTFRPTTHLMHCTSNLLRKKYKMNQTIENGKLVLSFIILGTRPTSILGPKTDQLV
jgi:hypothetical protein